MRVERGITDPLGHPAIGGGGPNTLGGSDTLLFAPGTFAFRGIVSHYHDGPHNSWDIHGWTLIIAESVADKGGEVP